MEDLQPFNTEIVARAVYDCITPIISAVGHETDFSLCDFASDLRAPTPSAAAELATLDIVKEIREFRAKSLQFKKIAEQKLESKEKAFLTDVQKLKYLGISVIEKGENKVKKDLTEILNKLRIKYMEKTNGLKIAMNKLDSLNPLKMLDKGFAKIAVEGRTVKSVKDVKVGDEMKTYLLGGEINSRITSIKEEVK